MTFEAKTIASREDATSVYVNGTRIDPSDYTIDHFEGLVETTLTSPARIMVHTIGSGSPSGVLTQAFFQGTGHPTFTLPEAALGHPEAIVDGIERSATILDNAVTVSPAPPAGSDVMITVYRHAPTRVHRQYETFTDPQAWIIDHPTDMQHQEEGTIVEVNGLRLTPPRFHYARLPRERALDVGYVHDVNNIKMFLDGAPMMTPIHLDEEPDEAMLKGIDLAYFLGKLHVINKTLMGDLKAIIYENNDYTILNNVVRIQNLLGFRSWDDLIEGIDDFEWDLYLQATTNDRIDITTFTNSALMGIRTMVHLSNDTGLYTMPGPIPDIDHLHVTVMGRRLIPNSEFYIRDDRTIFIPGTRAYGSLPIVITAFTGKPASPERTIALTSKRINGFTIFGDDIYDYDNRRWDTWGFDRLHDTPEAPFMRKLDGYEEHDWAYHGVIDADISETVSEIVVRLNPNAISPDVHPSKLFPIPDKVKGRAGVAYLGNERIEYWDVFYDGDDVTLHEIIRGTRGTSIGIEHRETMIAPASLRKIDFTQGDITRPIDVLMTVPGGAKRSLRPGTDFTVVTNPNGGVILTILDPIVGAMVTIGQSSQRAHMAGTKVYPERLVGNWTPFRGAH